MLHQQLSAFVTTLGIGISIGVLFDIYRVLRRLFGLKRVGTAIGDVLSWLMISVAAFVLLVLGNWAEMRLYVLLALVLGLALYSKTCSTLFQRSLYKLIQALISLVKFLIKCMVFPYKVIVKACMLALRGFSWLSLLFLRIIEYMVTFPHSLIRAIYKSLTKVQPPPQD